MDGRVGGVGLWVLLGLGWAFGRWRGFALNEGGPNGERGEMAFLSPTALELSTITRTPINRNAFAKKGCPSAHHYISTRSYGMGLLGCPAIIFHKE